MAIVYDNKEYRNLVEQVYENMKNIKNLQDLKLVGLDVKYIVDYVEDLAEIEDPEEGSVAAVGLEKPFTLYVYNDSS